MEFLNIGGGELLVIVLLAIVLFGPEDILRIMRTVGSYARKIQKMWAQMSAGLKGEFIPEEIIPEEVRQTIEDTKASVDEVKTTLEDVKTTVQADIDDTKATVKEVKTSLRDVDTTVKSDMREIPKTMRAVAASAVPAKDKPDAESVRRITAMLKDRGDDKKESKPPAESETPDVAATDVKEASESDEDTVNSPEVGDVVVAVPDTTATPVAKATVTEASPSAASTTDGTDPKTAALIASLLEGKERDTEEAAANESTPAADAATETAASGAAPTTQDEEM